MNELQRISADIEKAMAAGDAKALAELFAELRKLEGEGFIGCTELFHSMVPEELAEKALR